MPLDHVTVKQQIGGFRNSDTIWRVPFPFGRSPVSLSRTELLVFLGAMACRAMTPEPCALSSLWTWAAVPHESGGYFLSVEHGPYRCETLHPWPIAAAIRDFGAA